MTTHQSQLIMQNVGRQMFQTRWRLMASVHPTRIINLTFNKAIKQMRSSRRSWGTSSVHRQFFRRKAIRITCLPQERVACTKIQTSCIVVTFSSNAQYSAPTCPVNEPRIFQLRMIKPAHFETSSPRELPLCLWGRGGGNTPLKHFTGYSTPQKDFVL